MVEKIINLHSDNEAMKLYGSLDENLRFAEKHFDVQIAARERKLRIRGDHRGVRQATDFFLEHLAVIRGELGGPGEQTHTKAVSGEERVPTKPALEFFHKGKVIRARTKNQERYIAAAQKCDVVFSIGPAGTGKTYLAMAVAVDYLKKRRVSRIILTRPAVEAGESLGFLPGDMYAKINPYLRPLYDALYDMMDAEEVARYVDRGVIEIAPLAFMRGRTLNDSFVILDEGQNTTHWQMKMFLTRLGFSSKAIITGDITQVDLPEKKRSGLIEVQAILKRVKGVKFCYLTRRDVVRHKVVQDIVRAYEKHSESKE